MPNPILIERFPRLAGLPWESLGVARTPVERVDLAEGPLWIKRDDLTSPVYGGNKVRKLEFILAHARERMSTRLITAGAAGSHHALATTVFGTRAGFHVTLVLFPQPLTKHVRDVLLTDHALGADLRFTPRMTMVPAAVSAIRMRYWRERVQVVAPGGSDEYGTMGYVNAAVELAAQIEEGALPHPTTIVLAAGTLGTAAGLAIGLSLVGLEARIRAARITSRLVTNPRALASLIERSCRLLATHGVEVSAGRALELVELTHEQVGPGYGQATEALDAATRAFARVGLELDPTYTAKAAADCLAAMKAGSSGPVLFWHTLSSAMPAVTPSAPDALPTPFRRYLAAG